MTPLLEACEATCAYTAEPVLEDFSLQVQGGQVLALLGPNGTGKTTALRALARLLRPRRGRVTLGDEDIWRLPSRDYSRRVAYAPQFQEVEWGLTVMDTVSLGRAPHRGWLLPWTAQDRRVVAEVLERLGLSALAERRVETLSGGEKRRAVLARTLTQEPDILLLDEPTAHLDLGYQVEILDLLQDLAHHRGLAVVLTLHELNHAALWADEVALLHAGRLVARGDANAVLTAERIWETYGVAVEVLDHPVPGRPLIVPARCRQKAPPSSPETNVP